jgi:hypothetical protein
VSGEAPIEEESKNITNASQGQAHQSKKNQRTESKSTQSGNTLHHKKTHGKSLKNVLFETSSEKILDLYDVMKCQLFM